MQVYRGLDIGTAKPGPEERRRVPHHLIDVVDPCATFDAARFVDLSRKAFDDIRGRRSLPILCGGTGLYFKALLDGLGESPPSDPRLRAELEREPLSSLLQELKQADPKTHETIDRANPRRIVRAVEVIRLTQRPFSDQRASWRLPASPGVSGSGACLFYLSRQPDDLRRRIDDRVDRMFRNGLVEETRRLLSRGLERNRTAMQAIGYRQVVEHLRGERSLAKTVSLIKRKTWHYARRQRTWFHNQLTVQSLPVESDESAERTAERILVAWKCARDVTSPSRGGCRPA